MPIDTYRGQVGQVGVIKGTGYTGRRRGHTLHQERNSKRVEAEVGKVLRRFSKWR